MVPTVAVVRSDVIVEVAWDQTVVATVAINIGRPWIVVAVAAANWASVVVAIAVVARVVTIGCTGVIRRVALPHLYTQASCSERKSLCFRFWSIRYRQKANRDDRCCDPFDECGQWVCLV